MSHTPVVATTPILSASPGPATTNTYMRFNTPQGGRETFSFAKSSIRAKRAREAVRTATDQSC